MQHNVDLDEWARITERIWRGKIAKYRIGQGDRYITVGREKNGKITRTRERMGTKGTGQLLSSFFHHVNYHSNGNLSSIEMSFLMYGRFVDMRAGRGSRQNRKNRPWYSKTKYSETKKLMELLAKSYNKNAANIIIAELNY